MKDSIANIKKGNPDLLAKERLKLICKFLEVNMDNLLVILLCTIKSCHCFRLDYFLKL